MHALAAAGQRWDWQPEERDALRGLRTDEDPDVRAAAYRVWVHDE